MITFKTSKQKKSLLSVPAALASAEGITASSSSKRIVQILTSLHNGALAPRLLTSQGLVPVRNYMGDGGVFDVLARAVYARGLDMGPGEIYSWRYFACLAVAKGRGPRRSGGPARSSADARSPRKVPRKSPARRCSNKGLKHQGPT